MGLITFRPLQTDEVQRIREIDRTEKVRVGYRMESDRLIRMDVVWDSSPWREDGSEHSVQHMIQFLNEVIALGGTMMGALEGDRLVGIAAFRPRLTGRMGELALLHVSNGYRRRGIASHLCDQIEELARRSGARELYVSATPSQSAVGFYMDRGFEPTATPHPELLAREPDDIHLILRLPACAEGRTLRTRTT